jgi:hypothetical protein
VLIRTPKGNMSQPSLGLPAAIQGGEEFERLFNMHITDFFKPPLDLLSMLVSKRMPTLEPKPEYAGGLLSRLGRHRLDEPTSTERLYSKPDQLELGMNGVALA